MKGLKASFIFTQDTVDLRSLQRLAGKTTLFSRLYFTVGPRHLAIPLSSRKSINVSAVLLRGILY